MRANVVLDPVLRHGLDVVCGAQDGTAQRRVLKRRRVQVVKHNLFWVALNLLHLAQNHVLLHVDHVGLQSGVLEDVCNYVHCLGYGVLEHLGVVAGLLAGRVRV